MHGTQLDILSQQILCTCMHNSYAYKVHIYIYIYYNYMNYVIYSVLQRQCIDEEQLDVSDAGIIQQRETLNNMTV